jgi:hypothetical protein
MVKKLKFTIDANGEVQLDVQGAVGAECDKLTEPFEAQLGIVARKERKDSYYESQENEFQHTTSGGSLD